MVLEIRWILLGCKYIQLMIVLMSKQTNLLRSLHSLVEIYRMVNKNHKRDLNPVNFPNLVTTTVNMKLNFQSEYYFLPPNQITLLQNLHHTSHSFLKHKPISLSSLMDSTLFLLFPLALSNKTL